MADPGRRRHGEEQTVEHSGREEREGSGGASLGSLDGGCVACATSGSRLDGPRVKSRVWCTAACASAARSSLCACAVVAPADRGTVLYRFRHPVSRRHRCTVPVLVCEWIVVN